MPTLWLRLPEGVARSFPRSRFPGETHKTWTQPGACFDAVVCTQVLLYVPHVQTALEEMHRVLKPGGRIVVIETDWRGLVLQLVLCGADGAR